MIRVYLERDSGDDDPNPGAAIVILERNPFEPWNPENNIIGSELIAFARRCFRRNNKAAVSAGNSKHGRLDPIGSDRNSSFYDKLLGRVQYQTNNRLIGLYVGMAITTLIVKKHLATFECERFYLRRE